MKKINSLLIITSLLVLLFSCTSKQETLPYLGQHDFSTEYVDGELITDTIFYTIPEFNFVNQDGQEVNKSSVSGKVYIADFFFTSCPTICPKMSKNMLDLSKHYLNQPNVMFLSHSIDTRNDSVPVLKKYSERIDAPSNWTFVTGKKDHIFEIAEKYMVSASEDEHAPGGVIHSGAFILIDKLGRIRAYYDGTKKEEMEKVYHDIDLLLKENK
ncbi:MAG: SCO family protein [Salibacteraceae bacterium]